MELSLICPIKHIEWTKLLPGRFCLAPIALRHEEYRRYFTNASIDGYDVILDNGVFEADTMTNKDYLELAKEIQPTVLVVPDRIGAQAYDNYTLAETFAQSVGPALSDSVKKLPELMFVPQCEVGDAKGFKEMLHLAIAEPAFQWIGICRDVVYNAFGQWLPTKQQEMLRFFFTGWLLENRLLEYARDKGKKFHFLGMGEDVSLIQHHWYVDSMDTASIFFHSTMGAVTEGGSPLDTGVKRPRDYFIRDFGPEEEWLDILKVNCLEVLRYATAAKRMRQRILGGRL